MDTVSVKDAEAHFVELLDRVANGETVVIAREGKPIATMAPAPKPAAIDTSKRLGGLQGQLTIPEDFKGFMKEEIEEMFYGK